MTLRTDSQASQRPATRWNTMLHFMIQNLGVAFALILITVVFFDDCALFCHYR